MSKFASAINELIALTSTLDAEPAAMQTAASKVAALAIGAPAADLDGGLTRLLDSIAHAELPGAAIASLCCGAIVEAGGNPDIALPAVLDRVEEALALAQLFAEACEEMAAEDDDRAPTEDEETGDDNPLEKYGAEVAARIPENAGAFRAVEALALGAIAMLSRSPEGRQQALIDHPDLDALAGDLAPYHQRAHFFERMLDVLDDEPVIVLHPGERKGYRVRLNGIGTNFELFILLADALIGDPSEGWLPGKKPSAAVVAACRDQPTETAKGKSAEGAFNFFNWEALRADETLPPAEDYSSSDHWIWMEGIPADIDLFENQRIILLGPPPYARSIQAGRCFEGMTAEVRVEGKLSPGEVEQWLKRLAAAASAGADPV